MSKKWKKKNGLHQPGNLFPLIGMQDQFKNAFSQEGKIRLTIAAVSENGRKKWFSLAAKSVPTSRNKVIFQKLNFRFPLAEKNLYIKEYCFS